MPLTSLPLEILLLILDYLPAKPLLSLRATCKALLHVINPQIFSAVRLSPSRTTGNPRREQQCLESLSNPSSTIAPYVTGLHISSSSWRVPDIGSKLVVKTVLSDPYITPSIISKLRNLKTVW